MPTEEVISPSGDHVPLSPMQRVVAGQAVMGHSNKVIADELGIAIGTVGAHLHAIARRLGVRTRAAMVRRLLFTHGATPVGTSRCDGDAKLTAAERAVADLAASGHSNGMIAATRGVSTRTVANQLYSIYGKLGVTSRVELALARIGA